MTTCLNPDGAELPKTWIDIVQSPVIPQLIQEHASLFKEPGKNWATMALGLFYLACLAGVLPRRPRVTWLLPVVWLALACSRVRNTPLFALTAALALAEFFPQVCWARGLSDRGSVIFRMQPAGLPRPPREVKAWLVPGAAVLLTVLVSLASFNITGHGLARLDPGHWPVELLPDLKRYEETQPPGTPIMNDMLFGGFLIFYTPRLQVFVDDRCELYGDQFLLNYARNDPDFYGRLDQSVRGPDGLDRTWFRPGSLLSASHWLAPGEADGRRLPVSPGRRLKLPMKIVIILPTYNEKDNIRLLIPALWKQFAELKHEMHVLVVDDHSPDGTADAVREMMATYPNLHLITGEKEGLGAAYIRGMTYALKELQAEAVMEMDADFSHKPADVPRLLAALDEGADFVIGSRYVPGGSIPENWGRLRQAISRWGNIFARYLAGLYRVQDCTAGFRAIRELSA